MNALRLITVKLCVLLAISVMSIASAARAEDAEPFYGRVSAVEGNLAVRGAEEDDWSYVEENSIVKDEDSFVLDEDSLAEIELPGQVLLRLGDSAGLDVISIEEGRYRLWKGAVYVSIEDGADQLVAVETPVCAVVVQGTGAVRINVDEGGPVQVSNYEGDVQVFGAGESSVQLENAYALHVDSEGDFVGLGLVEHARLDALDDWNELRNEYYAALDLPEFASREALGVRDLGGAGGWIVEEDVEYWRPAVDTSWRPYYDGAWRHVEPVGYYWVPRHSFEFVTSHYGSWHWSIRFGWLWRPSWRWAPSRVAWVTHDDGVFWAPLDYYGYPVRVSTRPLFSLHISIGIGFDFYDDSWCYASFDHFRRHHRHHRPHYTVVNQTVINNNVVNIYNIRHAEVVRDINRVERFRPDRHVRSADTVNRDARRRLERVVASRRTDRRFQTNTQIGGGRLSDRLTELRRRTTDSGNGRRSTDRTSGRPTAEALERRVREFRTRQVRQRSEEATRERTRRGNTAAAKALRERRSTRLTERLRAGADEAQTRQRLRQRVPERRNSDRLGNKSRVMVEPEGRTVDPRSRRLRTTRNETWEKRIQKMRSETRTEARGRRESQLPSQPRADRRGTLLQRLESGRPDRNVSRSRNIERFLDRSPARERRTSSRENTRHNPTSRETISKVREKSTSRNNKSLEALKTRARSSADQSRTSDRARMSRESTRSRVKNRITELRGSNKASERSSEKRSADSEGDKSRETIRERVRSRQRSRRQD